MQVVPRFVSTAHDGKSEPNEFLRDYFDDPATAFGLIFLKGYQWPFDARKVDGGSSLIDLCVFYETAIRKRRVFLDYRVDPEGFAFERLPDEAREYLANSGADQTTPFARLERMNPNAVELYRDWGSILKTSRLRSAFAHSITTADWRSTPGGVPLTLRAFLRLARSRVLTGSRAQEGRRSTQGRRERFASRSE